MDDDKKSNRNDAVNTYTASDACDVGRCLLVVLIIGLVLFIGTEQTEIYFVWSIPSFITAGFLGSTYLAASVLELLCARERVRAEKPGVHEFSFLLKPLFRHNHTWSMQRGEASLKLELQRRRAKTPEELAQIPAPIAPLNTTPFVLLGLAGLLLLLNRRKRK